MNNAKLAAALGAGYVLGRMRKARWALALAGMAAGKKITTNPGALLADVLESSPQLRELAESVSGDLIGAGAKAGVAAASHRMEGLTERLEQRVESMRDSAGQRDEDEGEEEEEEAPKRKSTRGGGSGSRSASEKKSAPSKRSSTPRKRSTAPPSKKSPSRASSRSTTKKTTERKPAAKKTASSSPTRKSGGRSTGRSRSTSGSRASTRKE